MTADTALIVVRHGAGSIAKGNPRRSASPFCDQP
ncbi:MAG: hypothetical protein QOG75_2791, partial [Mycobacterium sp.]|nr:hypothetical protein [Mycobacterium sp.]